MKGLVSLKTPADLYQKLEHDLKRLEANPLDEFAAFDFFVTAYHLVDWVHPDHARRDEHQKKARAQFLEKSKLLPIAAELANGVKHFEQFRLNAVSDVVAQGDAWGGSWGKTWGKTWGENALIIKLSADEPANFSGVNQLNVLQVARDLRAFWKTELGV